MPARFHGFGASDLGLPRPRLPASAMAAFSDSREGFSALTASGMESGLDVLAAFPDSLLRLCNAIEQRCTLPQITYSPKQETGIIKSVLLAWTKAQRLAWWTVTAGFTG